MIYNIPVLFRFFNLHNKIQAHFRVFQWYGFSQRSQKYHHRIELFKTFSTICNMSSLLKIFSSTYQALVLFLGFFGFFGGKVSVDGFEKINIE